MKLNKQNRHYTRIIKLILKTSRTLSNTRKKWQYCQKFRVHPICTTKKMSILAKYVIVLEKQRTNAFYLLTAYHLNREYGEKALLKKMKKRIATSL